MRTEVRLGVDPAVVVEPVPIPDTVATGIVRLERLPGNWVRAVLCVDQASAEGEPEKVISARIVGPAVGLQDVLRQVLLFMEEVAMDEAVVTTVSIIPH